MNIKQSEIYEIFFIDRRTGRKKSIITASATWNADCTILNIVVKVPTKNGLINQDFQLSRDEYLSKEVHVPLNVENNGWNLFSNTDGIFNKASNET